MSMTLALNRETNDLMILPGGRGIQYVNGADEVCQRILVTLQHFYGEYFLNLPGGVPWYELILGGKDYRMMEVVLRQVVMNVPGVTGIMQFEAIFSKRRLSLSMVVSVKDSSEGIPVFYVAPYIPPITPPEHILDGGMFYTPRPAATEDGGGF